MIGIDVIYWDGEDLERWSLELMVLFGWVNFYMFIINLSGYEDII